MKFDLVGHEEIIFHERDIRKQTNQFAVLRTDAAMRESFLGSVNALWAMADVKLAASVILKKELVQRYRNPWSPYEIALHFCMEAVCSQLWNAGQVGKRVHVIFESRGSTEEKILEIHFRRIANDEAQWGSRTVNFKAFEWEPVFADKRSNSIGLQLADLAARPIGLSVLRPGQENRAFAALKPKLTPQGVQVFP